MDPRGRANSMTMKCLQGRQLASITDTLARASMRRDAELQKKTASKLQVAPAVQAPLPPSSSNSSFADTDGTASESGDSVKVVVDESGKGPDMRDFGFEEADMELSKGEDSTHGSLRGGHASDDEDANELPAKLEQSEVSHTTHDNMDLQQMLAHLDQSKPIDSGIDGPTKMLADLSLAFSGTEFGSETISSMLADLDKAPFVHEGTISEEVENFSPGDIGDGPRTMMAEIEGRTPIVQTPTAPTTSYDAIDVKGMLADLEQQTTRRSEEHKIDDEEDLEALHSRLTGYLSPGPAVEHTAGLQLPDLPPAALQTSSQLPSTYHLTNAKMTATELDPSVFPHVIAIELEKEGYKWEIAQAWTKYLFSCGLDGHEACREKDRIVQLAAEELDEIIRTTLVKEEQYQGEASIATLPRRLIVSNLAAGVSEEDLEGFLFGHRFAVQDYKILPDRDPVKRTQTAHVEMYTREAAIRASYMTGSIFGLVLDVRLAVEEG